MKYPNDIDFYYTLGDYGWSNCYLYVDGSNYHIEVKHIFENPIKVLLNALILILQGASEAEFKWYSEPGECIWSIKRNPKLQHKVRISISGCTEFDCEAYPDLETLQVEVKLKLLCSRVLKQMQEIRDSIDKKRIKEHRNYGFPSTIFSEFVNVYNQADL